MHTLKGVEENVTYIDSIVLRNLKKKKMFHPDGVSDLFFS